MIQFVFAIGASDINDLILNTSGGMIGIFIHKGMMAVFKKEKVRSFIAIASTVVGVMMIIMTVFLNIGNI